MRLEVKQRFNFSFPPPRKGGLLVRVFMYDFQPFYDLLNAMSTSVVPALLTVFLVGLTLSWISDLLR